MEELKLTDQQKKYLLYLEDFTVKNTISDCSKYFECSRTNSKKILDKMVKIGLLYKDDNNYILTSVGKSVSKKLRISRDAVSNSFKSIFFIDKVRSDSYANFIIGSESEVAQFLIRKAKRFKKAFIKNKTLNYKDLQKNLGHGNFPVSFVIYKNETGDKNSNIGFSMANKAYQDKAYIEIDEESAFVNFYSKALEKKHQGYFKKGVLQEMFYKVDGKEYRVVSKDSVLKVPLHVFDTWQSFGNGIFCSNIWIKHKVSIGLVNHSKKSNYLIILNLAEI